MSAWALDLSLSAGGGDREKIAASVMAREPLLEGTLALRPALEGRKAARTERGTAEP
jgi:hypothetical protein